MEPLNITIDGRKKTIGTNGMVFEGFYAAHETEVVEKNNEILGIEFEPLSEHSEAQLRLTKVDQYAFVTSKAEHGYMQYILLPSIDEETFYLFVGRYYYLPQLQQMLLDAFHLKGHITLASLMGEK